MGKREDLRVVKTRKALIGAVESLALEKDIEEVTVSELCARAGVSRSTFYSHFADKFDLVQCAIRYEFETMAKWGGPTLARPLETLLAKLRSNDFLCRRMRLGGVGTEAASVIEESLAEYMRGQISQGAWRPRRMDVPVDAALAYCAHGFAGVVAWWIRGGFAKPESEVAQTMCALLQAAFEIRGEGGDAA